MSGLPLGGLTHILLAVGVFLLVVHVRQLRHYLAKSGARERRLIEQCESLTVTLNRTTKNLEMQNRAVEQLLTEKGAAWGIQTHLTD